MSQSIPMQHHKYPTLMLKDLIQQCDHPFVEVQRCTASPNPAAVLAASLLDGLACLVSALPSRPLSHPTIGHRYQGNLRL